MMGYNASTQQEHKQKVKKNAALANQPQKGKVICCSHFNLTLHGCNCQSLQFSCDLGSPAALGSGDKLETQCIQLVPSVGAKLQQRWTRAEKEYVEIGGYSLYLHIKRTEQRQQQMNNILKNIRHKGI